MEYGLQLFSVRDLAEKNLDEALRQVSALGYKFVEFAGFFGHSAEEVRGMLEKYGLRVSGTHTGWQEIAEHFEETVAYHKAIGNTNIIVPGADLSDQKKLDAFIEMANEFQPRLAAEGIRMGYHNHSHEFKPNSDGSMIHDQLVYRTQLELEIDTFWAFAGGVDGMKNGSGMPLGKGEAPVAAVYQKAVQMGIPMVVESETLTPSGMDEARVCIEYLNELEKKYVAR